MAGSHTVIRIVAIPQSGGLGTQRFHVCGPQQIQNLLPAVAVRRLSQHRQRHIHIQRGVNHILLPCPGQKLLHGCTEVTVQPLGITHRLILLQLLAGPPQIIGRHISVRVEFPGFIDVVRVLGIGRHLRIVRRRDNLDRTHTQLRNQQHCQNRNHQNSGGQYNPAFCPPGPFGGIVFNVHRISSLL